MKKKTSLFENGLIWFGAGVSIAEILTGTYFSSLGFGKGLAAILIGHVIGCIMLFLAGVIGGSKERGIATASSTAAPKVRESSAVSVMGFPLKKMILLKISVRMKRAAMAMVLTLPRLVMPIRIQTMIRTPMTRHHTQ